MYWDPSHACYCAGECTDTKGNFLKSALEELIVPLEEYQKWEVVVTMQYQHIQRDKYNGNL